MQIVFVGQPELKELIARPSLRQLRQRISISCHLNPLNREESEEYIFHRLATVGNRDCVDFGEGAIDEIYRFSEGVPRLINLLCDFLLLSAFVEESKSIDAELVREAIEELSFDRPETTHKQADVSSAPAPQQQVVIAEEPEQKRHQHRSRRDERLGKIEKGFEQLIENRADHDFVLERLTSQGSILEYLINQQQNQFNQFEGQLQEIAGQIERLRQEMQAEKERVQQGSHLLA